MFNSKRKFNFDTQISTSILFCVYKAATTWISTRMVGRAMALSTQARTPLVEPQPATQSFQTKFMGAKSLFMSFNQMFVEIILVLSIPASASSLSILARVSWVWKVMSPSRAWLSWLICVRSLLVRSTATRETPGWRISPGGFNQPRRQL